MDPAAARGDSLRALRALTQVARLGSVSRAAAALGISQPAVSLQLQALAREHGVALFERSGRRLVPTPAGEALLALARPLVDGYDGLGEALRARLAAAGDDALQIAAGRVALRRLVRPAAERWADASPGVALQVRPAGGEAALALLRAGEVALAIGSWPAVPGDIEVQPLVSSPARLLVPAGHPLAAAECPGPADVARHVLVVPGDRQGTRQLVDLAFARAGVPMPPVLEAPDWAAVRDLVALGQGIAITNALAADGWARDGLRLLPLAGAFPPRPYGVAFRRGRPPAGLAARFAGLLRGTG